jgi:hypothetical protein
MAAGSRRRDVRRPPPRLWRRSLHGRRRARRRLRSIFVGFFVDWKRQPFAILDEMKIISNLELTPLKVRAERRQLLNPSRKCRLKLHGWSQGGAAEGVAGNRHKTDWPSHFVRVRY